MPNNAPSSKTAEKSNNSKPIKAIISIHLKWLFYQVTTPQKQLDKIKLMSILAYKDNFSLFFAAARSPLDEVSLIEIVLRRALYGNG